MANRREEERERLRQAREETRKDADQLGAQTRLMLGYGVAGMIGLVVLAGIVVAIAASGGGGGGESRPTSTSRKRLDQRRPARRPRPGPTPPAVKVTEPEGGGEEGRLRRCGCKLKDEGHTHIPPGSADARLQDQPADLGQPRRTALPAGRRRLQRNAAKIDIVHSLEHGRMEIQYSPDLPEEDQLELKGLYDTMYGGDAALPQRRTCPTRSRRRPGPTCSAARIQGRDHPRRDPRLRQGDLGPLRRRAGRRLPLHRPDPDEPSRTGDRA